MLTLATKPQWVCYKLEEIIKKPCSDFLVHTSKVCKGIPFAQQYLTAKDNRDSWGMCTTSAECKTVITVVLTVMSGMDPHTISENLRWVLVKSWLGFVEVGFFRLWVGHGETT
jgi:hypothetical protein